MKRVLVVGELNVDIVVTGTPRLPELGVELMVDDISVQMGSSSAICACGLARLGSHVSFRGNVGDDRFGGFVRETLETRGIDTSRVSSCHPVRTGITICIALENERAQLTYGGSLLTLVPQDVPPACLDGFHHLHMASYYLQEPLQPAFLTLFKAAKQNGMTTSFDTGCDASGAWNSGLRELFPFVDILLVNESEAIGITGEENWRDAGRTLSGLVPWLPLKRGAGGSCLFHEGKTYEAGPLAVESIDTTGAGDSFNAGFIHGFLEGWPPEKCLRLANVCGALSTQATGGITGQATHDQALDLLDRIDVRVSAAE